jgi:hypothetical protein
MTGEDSWKLPWEGGCICGRLRIRITTPPLFTSVCHCRGCQRLSGSAFSTAVTVQNDGFAVIAGEPVVGGLHAAWAQHQHCDFCKGWVFSSFGPDAGFVNVRATMLDDAGWFEPFVEMQTAEMLPWARTPAKHRFERFPPDEDYGALVAAFASEGKRP